MKKIIDLSHYNTVTDWNAVKDAVDGVILRCGYRGYGSGKIVIDKKFIEYANACKVVGLPFGLYFMSQAINETEAIEEAVFTAHLAELFGASLPLFIDSEDGDGTARVVRADGLSQRERTAVVKAFCNKINELNYVGGVYASESWFTSRLVYEEVTQYYIWVADYGKNTGYKVSSIALKKYDMHQYTSRAKVSGIIGNVDISEMYTFIGANDQATQPPVVTETEESYYMKTIKKGSKGNAVKVWQIIVGVKSDGDFGINTEKATREFQKARGLTVDGIVGKNSWKAGLESL